MRTRAHFLFALTLVAVAPRSQSTLDSALAALVEDPNLAGARVAVCVRDLADNRDLLRHDHDKGCMTASNMKLISSAVALLTLGPDFAFVTRLVGQGVVLDGVLDGDLVLTGAGDPTLGGRQEKEGPRAPFLRLARRLLDEHGIREVTGAVLGDDDCQPDEVMGEGWAWGYEAADYAAQVSGLCFAENVVHLEFLPTAATRHPALHLSPETSYLTIDNRVIATEGTTSIDVGRARASNHVTLRGQLAAGRPHRDAVSVDNPTAFAAHVLRECLIEVGIRVRGAATGRDEAQGPTASAGILLGEERSPPLREMLRTLNKTSQNLYAEQLVRAAARAATGNSHMRDAAAHAMTVLSKAGVDTKGMVIADGSGLTRLNLVQPKQLVDLLAVLWRNEHRDVFIESLPVAGIDGTLSERMKVGPARGRVRAKTGFISRVVALSGYVARPDGAAPLAFSVLLNNFTCESEAAKSAVDNFAQQLAHAAK